MSTAARRQRLLHLLHRSSLTVPQAAEKLGISERTAYRDVAALRDEGHSIEGSPGPGGGVRLARGSRPQPVHFEVAEIIGLALSVAVMKATPGLPFSVGAEAALDRARRALSRERQLAMQRIERRILVGDPSTSIVIEGLGQVDARLLAQFEAAFTGQLALEFAYTDRNGASTVRKIECVALLLRHPAWYILAWDLRKDAPRMFRMDRIANARASHRILAPHALSTLIREAAPDARNVEHGFLGPSLLG